MSGDDDEVPEFLASVAASLAELPLPVYPQCPPDAGVSARAAADASEVQCGPPVVPVRFRATALRKTRSGSSWGVAALPPAHGRFGGALAALAANPPPKGEEAAAAGVRLGAFVVGGSSEECDVFIPGGGGGGDGDGDGDDSAGSGLTGAGSAGADEEEDDALANAALAAASSSAELRDAPLVVARSEKRGEGSGYGIACRHAQGPMNPAEDATHGLGREEPVVCADLVAIGSGHNSVTLAVVAPDYREGALSPMRIARLATFVNHRGDINGLCFGGPDERYLITCSSDDRIGIIDLKPFLTEVFWARFSGTDASGLPDSAFSELGSTAKYLTVDTFLPSEGGGTVWRAAPLFTPEGACSRYMVCGGSNSRVFVVDVVERSMKRWWRHGSGWVVGLAATTAGIITATEDGDVVVHHWTPEEPDLHAEGSDRDPPRHFLVKDNRPRWGVALGANYIFAASDRGIDVFDPTTGRLVQRAEGMGSSKCRGLAANANGVVCLVDSDRQVGCVGNPVSTRTKAARA